MMNQNSHLEIFSQSDRRWLSLGLLLIVSGLVFLLSERFFGFVFGARSFQQNLPSVAKVDLAKNDVRHRLKNDWAWNPSEQGEEIYLGDGLFSGEGSQTRLVLAHGGGAIEMGENTLIVFSQTNQFDVPYLSGGNFRLVFGQDQMRIRIGNQLVELRGTPTSEVQVDVDSNIGTRLKTLKGQVEYQVKDKLIEGQIDESRSLDSDTFTEINQATNTFSMGLRAPASTHSTKSAAPGRQIQSEPPPFEPRPPKLKTLEEMRALPPDFDPPGPVDHIEPVETLVPRR